MDVCPNFPCGVKTTYRKYASDEVFELSKDDTVKVGLKVEKVLVKTFPEATPAANGRPARDAGTWFQFASIKNII